MSFDPKEHFAPVGVDGNSTVIWELDLVVSDALIGISTRCICKSETGF